MNEPNVWRVVIFHFVLLPSLIFAESPRVLPPGQLPADSRLGPLRSERGDFSFVPAKSPDAWKKRAEHVRRTMLVAQGLWPMPTKAPLRPVIHGKIDCGTYTVEKVYFESIPGLYVTGNLYRPKTTKKKLPAVLSPHGHFPGGRFQDAGRDRVRQQIVRGAERFEEGGRSFMQSRCVQLARMGCVVFHYDMVGYGDCLQLSDELVHRFSRTRIKYKTAPKSGFYSAAALSRLQNILGLHTYNSIRALDFLTSLPDVDPSRIAVTGGSGGGTQTFMLCAIDERPLVSVPVVIVSTDRQGGCTCENICGLRFGTYNLEFTALHAPKPLMLISADDATRTMSERGFPELRQHYAMLGAKDKAAHVPLLHFPHNYNYVSRAAMYSWLNKHLKLGLKEPIVEQDYVRLTREQLTVWNEDHPKPPSGIEDKLLTWWTHDAQRQMSDLMPHDMPSLKRYREVVGGAMDVLIRQGVPDSADVRFEELKTVKRENYEQTSGLLRYQTGENHQAELPAIVLKPRDAGSNAVVMIDPQGKSALFDEKGMPAAQTSKLLNAGATIIGVDVFMQGEFLRDGKPFTRQRWLENEEGFAGWTYCYNLPTITRRVHDILAVTAFAKSVGGDTNDVHLVGLRGAGHIVAVALTQLRGSVTSAAIITGGFRFESVTDVYGVDFLPGAVKYNDVPGILALAAPMNLWVAGEGDPLVAAAYEAAGKPDRLTQVADRVRDQTERALDWVIEKFD